MPEKKKERREKQNPIGEQLEKAAYSVSLACCITDLMPPKTSAEKDFIDFIKLIVYCNEHKMYQVRDEALKKILEELDWD